MTWRRPLLAGTTLLVTGLLLVACGLPSDDTAQDISPDAVPFDLLAPSSTTVPDDPQAEETDVVNLYFQNDERLIAVPAEVPRDDETVAFDPQAAVSDSPPVGMSSPAAGHLTPVPARRDQICPTGRALALDSPPR